MGQSNTAELIRPNVSDRIYSIEHDHELWGQSSADIKQRAAYVCFRACALL